MEARIEALLRYAEICQHRRDNPPTDADGYCEWHHALPRSLGGGEGENLVMLPAMEHIEAHIELARAIGDQEWGRGMAIAAHRMTHGKCGRFFTVERAAEAREQAVRAQRGVPLSGETRAKISAAKRGVPKSEETRRKIGDAQRGVPKPWQRGKSLSDETRAKISAAQRGVPRPWQRGEKNPMWGRGELQRGEKNPMWGRTGYQNPAFKPDLLLFERIATGERFALTRRQAIERLGIPASQISNLIAGRKRTAHGYRLVPGPE